MRLIRRFNRWLRVLERAERMAVRRMTVEQRVHWAMACRPLDGVLL